MKSFALTLFATAATASHYGSSYDPSYKYSGSRSKPSYSQSYVNPYSSQYKPKTQYPTQHGHYDSYTPAHSHQTSNDPYHAHANGSTHQVNPWEQTSSNTYGSNVPDGWLNPYQQYSKPQIAYKPEVDAPTFTVCEFIIGDDPTNSNTLAIEGSVEIVQVPHKPATVKWDLFSMGTYTEDFPLYPRINETGRLFTADANSDYFDLGCSASTKEFNPLKETDRYGRVNPYQDFSRGRLDSFDFVFDTDSYDGIQNYLLQNLAGKNSIVGRSINLYAVPLADVVELDGYPTDTPTLVEACCVIALDETPYRWLPQPHYHAKDYGYNNYGHGHSKY